MSTVLNVPVQGQGFQLQGEKGITVCSSASVPNKLHTFASMVIQ